MEQSLNRPLTQPEQKLIRWLIEHGEPGHDELIAQIDRLTVIWKCSCGCPTVNFALDSEPVAQKGEGVISDYCGTVDGKDVGVLLFQNAGRLSCLEVYSFTGSDEPFGLPEIETLYSFEQASSESPK